MKIFALISMAFALVAPPVAHAEMGEDDATVLSGFSRPLMVRGGPLWVTVLTDRTTEALWRDDAALQTLRIEMANAGVAFHVVGVATRPTTIDPKARLCQGDACADATIVNMGYLNGVAAPEGAAIIGLIESRQRIDLGKPFVLELGGAKVEFILPADLVRKWGKVTRPEGQGF